MIPLRDNIPHYTKPIVTVSLVIVNVCVFLYELMLGRGLGNFLFVWGFVPQNVFLPVGAFAKIAPLFTSMFLHGGWLHLIGNMWFLWIFGDNVEDRMGHFSFLSFYILCGLGAHVAHFVLNSGSGVPVVGASGAIAGVLGAYMFLFPGAQVLTLIPLFIIYEVINIPAFIFLGLWFLYQFFLGVGTAGSVGPGVAFWAHIGGFIVGILLLKVFVRKKRYHYSV